MKKCNSGSTCPVSGKNICCKSCDKLQTCPDACEDALDLTKTCPDEADEPEQTALQQFQTKEVNVIQAMTDLLNQKKSFENEFLKVTYVAATSKTTIDSKTLKKEMPDVYEKYSKTSPVAASVRISLK